MISFYVSFSLYLVAIILSSFTPHCEKFLQRSICFLFFVDNADHCGSRLRLNEYFLLIINRHFLSTNIQSVATTMPIRSDL